MTIIAGVLLMVAMGARKDASCDPASSRRAIAWDVMADETCYKSDSEGHLLDELTASSCKTLSHWLLVSLPSIGGQVSQWID